MSPLPGKRGLAQLKEESYRNAVRLFHDSCTLFQLRSYASALALTIFSQEEVGKLFMLDRLCDDLCLNPELPRNEAVKLFFSRDMMLSHVKKHEYSASPFERKTKNMRRLVHLAAGHLERRKQMAIYAGYRRGRVEAPRMTKRKEAYRELREAYQLLMEIGDLGFNGFDCWSDGRSRNKATHYRRRIRLDFGNCQKGSRKQLTQLPAK